MNSTINLFYRPYASNDEIRSMVESNGLEIPNLNPSDVLNNIQITFKRWEVYVSCYLTEACCWRFICVSFMLPHH